MTENRQEIALKDVQDHNGLVSSRRIAERFDKEHKNVLAAIRQELEIPDEFNRLNFQPVTYTDSKGEERPEYLLTRDGFTMIAMSLTGREAREWKKVYIQAFNAMERELKDMKVFRRVRHDVSEYVKRLFLPAPREWETRFTPPFIAAICELYGWNYDGKRIPRQMQSIFDKLYRKLLGDDGKAALKARNPNPRFGSAHHQHLSDDIDASLPSLQNQLIYIANKAGRNKDYFWRMVDEILGIEPTQVELAV
jgi:Rha family phage regulatory protein